MSSSRVQITFTGRVDRLRHQRGLDRIVVLQSPAESSAHQRDVDFHLIGIESNRRRDRVAAILRNLRRRPQFAFRSLIMRRAISRLHRRVRHEGQFIFGGDVPSGQPSRHRPPEYRLAPFFDAACFSDATHRRGIQIFIRPFIPRNVEHAAAFHRAPHAVGDHRDRRVADLSDVSSRPRSSSTPYRRSSQLSRRSSDSATATQTSSPACGSRCRKPLRPSLWRASRARARRCPTIL